MEISRVASAEISIANKHVRGRIEMFSLSTNKTVEGHGTGPYREVKDHIGPNKTIQEHTCPYKTSQDHVV